MLGLVLLATVVPARAELWTMGTGDEVFARFGHSALCIYDDQAPEGLCFNYGTSDFRRPVALGWGVLRGRATFWVSTTRPDTMVNAYKREDRTLYRQRLPLTPEVAQGLARALRDDLTPGRRTYTYRFFADNCATRLRDHLDRATGGLLRLRADQTAAESYREEVRRAFGGEAGLLVASELFLGRFADRPPSVWEAMFLPEVLRREVRSRFGVAPEVIYERRGPRVGGDPVSGMRLLIYLAAGLAAVTAAAFASRRRALRRTALVVCALVLGLLGALLDFLALASHLQELKVNELLLVFVPTDLLLAVLDGGRLRVYLAGRVALLLPVAAAVAAGVLRQPLWAPLALVAGALAPALAFEALGARKALTFPEQGLLDSAQGGEPR